MEARKEKMVKNPSQEPNKVPSVAAPKSKYFYVISSPSMWDFTGDFLSPIGSLVFSQILDSHNMIRPRVFRTSTELHELIS